MPGTEPGKVMYKASALLVVLSLWSQGGAFYLYNLHTLGCDTLEMVFSVVMKTGGASSKPQNY